MYDHHGHIKPIRFYKRCNRCYTRNTIRKGVRGKKIRYLCLKCNKSFCVEIYSPNIEKITKVKNKNTTIKTLSSKWVSDKTLRWASYGS